MSIKSISINGKLVKEIKLNNRPYYQSFSSEYERLEYVTIHCDAEHGYSNYILTDIQAPEIDEVEMKISKSPIILSGRCLMILKDFLNSRWVGINTDSTYLGNLGDITNWNILTENNITTITFNISVQVESGYLSTGHWGDEFYSYTHREYGFKYKKEGVVLCNFIPCRRKSDGVCGMYDLVSRLFKTNAGLGGNEAITAPE